MPDTPPPGSVPGQAASGPPPGAVAGVAATSLDPAQVSQMSMEEYTDRLHRDPNFGEQVRQIRDKLPQGMQDTIDLVEQQEGGPSSVAGGIATGIGKGAEESLSPLLSAAGSPLREGETEAQGLSESLGKGIETSAEFLGGEEAIKGAASFAKVAQRFPQVIALIDKYPKAAKILLGGARAGVVGAAQGAARESKEGGEGAVAGAEAGGIGGAVGGAAGEALNMGPKVLASLLKRGTPEEAMVSAGRPAVTELNFKDSVKKSLPALVEAASNKPFKTVGEFVNLLHDTMGDLWKGVIQPQIDRHSGDIIDGTPIAQSIRSRITSAMVAMPRIFRSEVAEIQAVAKDFDNFNFSLKDANEFLKTLNAKLASFYRMSPVERAASRITDGYLTSLEAARDGLGDAIIGKLTAAGEQTPAEFRQIYGSLKDMFRVFGKRATVEERQAPLNLTQVLGMTVGAGAGAIHGAKTGDVGEAIGEGITGGVTGLLLPLLAKRLNSAGSLANRAISLAEREAGGQPIRSAVAAGTKKAVGAVIGAGGEEAGREMLPEREQGMVRFRASDGSIHDVPAERLDDARQIDPKLEVIEQ